jgi:alanyl-tRNA synthetase
VAPTEKLFFRDALLTRFDARLLAVSAWKGAPSLVLDRTAFYAEAGGQLADRGHLRLAGGDELEVLDVQVDDDGTIHHVIASAPAGLGGLGALAGLAGGAPLVGEIDLARRRDHMSQHTGQHMLSRALVDVAGAETVSSRLGSEASTIDLGVQTLDEAKLAEAEARVNDAVLEDREVRVLFPTPSELAALPLRRAPKVATDVRVIEVDGFDFSPCGGTHCLRTGQVGPVRVVGTERYKGGVRVTFLAGKRALAEARANDAILRELARAFTCGVPAVPAAVAKLRADLERRTERLAAAKQELIELLVRALHADHPAREGAARAITPIVSVRERDDLAGLRTLASALARRPDVVAFVATRDESSGELQVAIERGASASTFDAGKWLKALTARHGGRGGGRAERAEGRLPAAIDWPALVRDEAFA